MITDGMLLYRLYQEALLGQRITFQSWNALEDKEKQAWEIAAKAFGEYIKGQ